MGKTEEFQELVEDMKHLKYQYNDSVELVNRELIEEGLVVEGSLITKLNTLIGHLKRRGQNEATTC